MAHFTFYPSRLFEWLSSMMMMSMAVVVTVDPKTLGRGGFFLMHQVGITPTILYFITFSFGGLRLGALIANGMSLWWGPRVRMAVSLMAALLWGEMGYSLIVWSLSDGYLTLGVPIYFFLAVGELISSYRASSDAKYPIR